MMLMTLLQAKSWMKSRLSSRRGQNTVEYLMMLAVIVAVVVLAGGVLKKYMPNLVTKITTMIEGAATEAGTRTP